MTQEEMKQLQPGDRVRIINNEHKRSIMFEGVRYEETPLANIGRVYVVKGLHRRGIAVETTPVKVSFIDKRIPESIGARNIFIPYDMIEKVTLDR